MCARDIFRLINKYEEGVKDGYIQKREEGEYTVYTIDGMDLVKVETKWIF